MLVMLKYMVLIYLSIKRRIYRSYLNDYLHQKHKTNQSQTIFNKCSVNSNYVNYILSQTSISCKKSSDVLVSIKN